MPVVRASTRLQKRPAFALCGPLPVPPARRLPARIPTRRPLATRPTGSARLFLASAIAITDCAHLDTKDWNPLTRHESAEAHATESRSRSMRY
jgi:hypothetical protein